MAFDDDDDGDEGTTHDTDCNPPKPIQMDQ